MFIVKDLMASSGEQTTPRLTLPFQGCRRTRGGLQAMLKYLRPSLEPVFGLSILGYCINGLVQQSGLEEKLLLM